MNLSNLIKECGKCFISLIKYQDEWGALGNKDNVKAFYGKTPEEAVKKLLDYLKENSL